MSDENHPVWRAIDLGGGQTCNVNGVLRELARAGYVIVPKEPTNKMICAALDQWDLGNRTYTDQWRAMVDASDNGQSEDSK